MLESIIINQTLHGYKEGHRLLAASCEIPSNSERVLLELSDLSGDGIVRGFEEYLTGYSLPEHDFKLFAFAKTWYAHEMERPGCVWTHTLLLNIESLKHIVQSNDLLSLFHRPVKGTSFSSYQEQISLQINQEASSVNRIRFQSQSFDSRTLLENLFYSLYQYKRSVVVLSHTADQVEDHVLSIWLQQWPALRANFSFCTGSLSPRLLPNKKPFMLQIAPEKNYYNFFRHRPKDIKETNKPADVIEVNDLLPKKLNEWYQIPISNLLGQNQESYLRFLWDYGQTVSPLRTSFSRLTQIYWRMDNVSIGNRSLSDLTALLKQRYPKPTDIQSLKVSIYGSKKAWTYIHNERTDLELLLLNELIETEHYDIFDVDSLELEPRITQLWDEEPNNALQILQKCLTLSASELNPIRHTVLRAAVRLAPSNVLFPVEQIKTDLLETILSLNPKISESPLLWQADENRQRYLFARLLAIANSEETESANRVSINWQMIAEAMLYAGSDLFADYLDRYLGDELPSLILRSYKGMSNGNPPQLGARWLKVLSNHPKQLIDWLQLNRCDNSGEGIIAAHALIAKVLNPHLLEVKSAGSEIWLDLARHADTSLHPSDKMLVMSFLLAVGLSHHDSHASELVSHSFETVYEAARNDALPWGCWSYLDKLAPSYGLIWSWDKCHRLEEALLKKIIKREWPPVVLFKAIKSPQTFRMIMKRANDAPKGRKLLRELYGLIETGVVHPRQDICSLLKNYL
jgi:hypothetical protein